MAKNETQTQELSKNQKKKNGSNDKYDLARVVLNWGLITIGVLGVAAIVFSTIWGKKDEVFDSVKEILTLLLPVIGAWVGTVLAYYFSRDNFEAAARSTRDMYKEFKTSEEKLKSKRADKVMIDIKQAQKLVIEQGKTEADFKLQEDLIEGILEKDKNNPRKRLPILDHRMYPKYLIHLSIITDFMVKKSIEAVEKKDEKFDIKALTLQHMLDDNNFNKYLTHSFGTIKEMDSLLDAKNYIDSIDICLDVYITENGSQNSPAIGWITNAIITKESSI